MVVGGSWWKREVGRVRRGGTGFSWGGGGFLWFQVFLGDSTPSWGFHKGLTIQVLTNAYKIETPGSPTYQHYLSIKSKPLGICTAAHTWHPPALYKIKTPNLEPAQCTSKSV